MERRALKPIMSCSNSVTAISYNDSEIVDIYKVCTKDVIFRVIDNYYTSTDNYYFVVSKKGGTDIGFFIFKNSSSIKSHKRSVMTTSVPGNISATDVTPIKRMSLEDFKSIIRSSCEDTPSGVESWSDIVEGNMACSDKGFREAIHHTFRDLVEIDVFAERSEVLGQNLCSITERRQFLSATTVKKKE